VCLLILTFVCSWFRSLFTDYAMMFTILERRKRCWPFKILFWYATNVMTFLTMDKNKNSFNFTRIWHYLSIYFSILDCLNCLGFLWMFLLLIVDIFLFKKFQENHCYLFSQPSGHHIEFLFQLFLIKFVLLVKVLVWSM